MLRDARQLSISFALQKGSHLAVHTRLEIGIEAIGLPNLREREAALLLDLKGLQRL